LNLVTLADQDKCKLLMIFTIKSVKIQKDDFKSYEMKMTFDYVSKNILSINII